MASSFFLPSALLSFSLQHLRLRDTIHQCKTRLVSSFEKQSENNCWKTIAPALHTKGELCVLHVLARNKRLPSAVLSQM